MIDIAGTAIDFVAAVHNCLHDLGAPVKTGLIGRLHAAANALELEFANVAQHIVGQWVIRHHRQSPQKRRLENLEQIDVKRLGKRRGIGPGGRIGAEFHDGVGAGITRHDNHAIFEIDVAAFAVTQHALVKHLIEDVLHAGVRLFHFIEQHHAVRTATHRLGQHASFAVAHVARRRAHQKRHFMFFFELTHVDDCHVVFAAEEQFGKREGRFGFAHTARPGQEKHSDRPARIGEAGPRGANPFGNGFKRVRLSDNPLFHSALEFQHAANFV